MHLAWRLAAALLLVTGCHRAAPAPVCAAVTPARWRAISTHGAPATGHHAALAWTGRELLVLDADARTLHAWDPCADAWRPLAPMPPPMAASLLSAWAVFRREPSLRVAGGALLVWTPPLSTGGVDAVGARYELAGDRWSAMSTAGAPPRFITDDDPADGDRIIIWGETGARATPTSAYDVRAGRWETLAHPPPGPELARRFASRDTQWAPRSMRGAPSPRFGAVVRWAGARLVVWGGVTLDPSGRAVPLLDGAMYDPARDAWAPMPTPDAPVYVQDLTARSIDEGGIFVQVRGVPVASFDVTTNRWRRYDVELARPDRDVSATVWTGRSLVSWGGARLHFSGCEGPHRPCDPVVTTTELSGGVAFDAR